MTSSVRHPHGEAEWADRESDRKIVRDCLQCCHCQHTWFVVKGSGRKRGFCRNCMGPTCGKPGCEPCLHWKKKIELIDAGMADRRAIFNGRTDGLPVSVAITAAVPGQKKLILPSS